MSNLGVDTAVSLIEAGRYEGKLNRDWEIWGPNGGYIASVALRAAAAHAALPRPASFSCQYLAVGNFEEPVRALVDTARRTKRAECVTVRLEQGDRLLLTAQAWFIDENHEGLEHDFSRMPEIPSWSECPTVEEHLDRMGVPEEERIGRFKFWLNFVERPTVWFDNWEDRPAGEPVFSNWVKYADPGDWKDVAVDAARLTVIADTVSWPANMRAYSGPVPWMGPSLDLNVQFHRFEPEADWLLMYGRADVSTQGLFAFNGQVWSENGTLLASSSGQCFYRKVEQPS
ncbi:MAG: thioesterase family protein [Acidimicrobiales bacterium]|nr:thioesterase family protein [Acidimicrobiales bacterium]